MYYLIKEILALVGVNIYPRFPSQQARPHLIMHSLKCIRVGEVDRPLTGAARSVGNAFSGKTLKC